MSGAGIDEASAGTRNVRRTPRSAGVGSGRYGGLPRREGRLSPSLEAIPRHGFVAAS